MLLMSFLSSKTSCPMRGLKGFLESLGTLRNLSGENIARIGFSFMTFYFLKSLEAHERFRKLLKEINIPNISGASGVKNELDKSHSGSSITLTVP